MKYNYLRGYGWSSAGLDPRDTKSMITELKMLLERIGVNRPFIYGGWSFGGMNAIAYASLHLQDLNGLILLDSLPLNALQDSTFRAQLQEGIMSFNILRYLAPLGASRIAAPFGVLPEER